MRRATPVVLVIVLVAVVAIIFLSSRIFYTIQPGHAGILFRRYSTGLDYEKVYNDGFHIIAPWNDVIIYEIREQATEEGVDIIDKNGLSISVDLTVRFKPVNQRLAYLHNRFGPQYPNTLVKPEIRATVRQVMGQYSADEIYSTKRSEVEENIKDKLIQILGSEENNVEVNTSLIRSIKLPQQIIEAIESKQRQEQELLAYQFRLQTEKQEAERKRVLAEGEAAANRIVEESLTDRLLRMRGIEATKELADSENAKIIVIGSGDDGLPIILGNN
ncbi:MAG TPA: peptidase [Cytophagales bacterium]|nr:peptidase [Cytophagales bacterium]HAA17614.1 peptidase [Cytophagales bacterium]HAP63967.1 peptidase [Cytophagales bacterium]